MPYPLSLAAGNLPEFSPLEIYNAAVSADFDQSGMWVDLETWTDQTTRDLKSAIADAGKPILDVEVMWMQPGESVDPLKRTIDIGEELNAQFGLAVSSDPDPVATKKGFETLCRHAETTGLTLVLEPLPITEVKSLAQAFDIVSDVDHPRGKLLIDTLHLQRMGGSPDDLSKLGPDWFPYLQIADAPLDLEDPTFERLLSEAVDGRLLPGDGDLPIRRVMEQLAPDIPISPEIRSAALRDGYPDPVDRARAILESCRSFLS